MPQGRAYRGYYIRYIVIGGEWGVYSTNDYLVVSLRSEAACVEWIDHIKTIRQQVRDRKKAKERIS